MFDPVETVHKLTEAAKNIAEIIQRSGTALEKAKVERALRALHALYFFDGGVVEDLRAIAFAGPNARPRVNGRRIGRFQNADHRVRDALDDLDAADSISPTLFDIDLKQQLRSIAFGKINVRTELQHFFQQVRQRGRAEQIVAAGLLADIAALNYAIAQAERSFVEKYAVD